MARARSVSQGNHLALVKETMNFSPLGFRRHFVISDQYTFWNDQLLIQQITRFWCDVVARHRFPKRPLGSQVSFFSQISKKVQKSRSKSGDRMMLAPMANRFKERSLLEQLQNHASNHQGAPGLSTPSDPPRKKWLLFGSSSSSRRTGFPRFCFASLNVKSASRKNHAKKIVSLFQRMMY